MPRRLLFIGLDAADWQTIQPMLQAGHLPTFERLCRDGSCGELRTLHPCLSPMLWTSIVTGKRAADHGIHGFTTVDRSTGGIRPVSSADRTCRALWNILHAEGRTCHVANWFASYPAEPIRGSVISDRFPHVSLSGDEEAVRGEGVVAPAALEEELSPLRLLPEEVDSSVLDLMFPAGTERTPMIEQARAFLSKLWARAFSIHNGFTRQLESGAWDFAAVYHNTLDAVAHSFMHWQPPKLDWVSQEGYDQLHTVLGASYRMFDLMVARLVELAGKDADVVIVSDHGFKSGSERVHPGRDGDMESFHREHGIGIFSGPSFQRGGRFSGASLLDVTPTILSAFGLPVGRDMPGRVLAEIFAEPPEPAAVESWDAEPGDFAECREKPRCAGDEGLAEHFADLGYLNLTGNRAVDATRTRRTNEWNLARDHIDAGRPAEATHLLVELYAAQPADRDAAVALAQCLASAGKRDAACEVLERLVPAISARPEEKFLLGCAAAWRGGHREALAIFAEVERSGRIWPELLLAMASACRDLGQGEHAEDLIRRAVAMAPDHAFAWRDLAKLLLAENRPLEALTAGLRAVEIRHDLPVVHYSIARCLERLNMSADAEKAFRLTLALMPDYIVAREAFADFLHKANRPEEARSQRETAERVRRERGQERLILEDARARLAQDVTRLREAFQAVDVAARSPKRSPRVIVSGLPRSGTSLMMSMLRAGGVEVCMDDARPADPDNPRGYFEWSGVDRLYEHPGRIEEAAGKAVKILIPQLRTLPMDRDYKMIFLLRDLDECVGSQMRMKRRNASGDPAVDDLPLLREKIEAHRAEAITAVKSAANLEVLWIDFAELVDHPRKVAVEVSQFLGLPDGPPLTAMTELADPSLPRSRKSTGN